MWRIVARTSEEQAPGVWMPVLEHHFLGGTLEEAMGIYAAHYRADPFFRGCSGGVGYNGIVCRTDVIVLDR